MISIDLQGSIMEITVNLHGSLKETVNWYSRGVHIVQEKATVEDVLKSIEWETDTSLFNIVADGEKMKLSYIFYLNGKLLWHPVNVKTEVSNNDQLDILDFPIIAGG